MTPCVFKVIGGALLVSLMSCSGNSFVNGRSSQLSAHVSALTGTPDGMYEAARWSPDGTMIAAVVAPESEGSTGFHHVVLLRSDGIFVHEVARPPGATSSSGDWKHALAWHPDGSLVVVADMLTQEERLTSNPLPNRYALFHLDVQAPERPVRQLSRDLATIYALDWSPDGKRLAMQQDRGAFIPQTDSRYEGVAIYQPGTGELVEWQYHNTWLERPRWRPDGDEMLYVAGTMPGRKAPVEQELIIRPWPDGTPDRVTLAPDCSLSEAAWSPQGDYIVYREACNNLNGKRVDHLVIASRARPVERVEVCDGMSLTQPDWGRDAQLLALTVAMGRNEIVVCDVTAALATLKDNGP